MSIESYGHESVEAMNRRLAVRDITDAVNQTGIPDRAPDCVDNLVRHNIASRGMINGQYFIETSRKDVVGFDTAPINDVMSQTFGVSYDGEDFAIINYSNDKDGPDVDIDMDLFEKIDVNDLSVFDLVDYDSMARIIYAVDDGLFDIEQIMDRPYTALFMHQNSRWLIEESSSPETTNIHYMISEIGDLVTVRTQLLTDGTTHRLIDVSDDKRQTVPGIEIAKEGDTGETTLTKPAVGEDVVETSRVIVGVLKNAVLL